jgi:hypothetical protein
VDYPTCVTALEVCRVNKVLDQHLTRPEELEEGEEVAHHNATFSDATRKNMCQLDATNNIILAE